MCFTAMWTSCCWGRSCFSGACGRCWTTLPRTPSWGWGYSCGWCGAERPPKRYKPEVRAAWKTACPPCKPTARWGLRGPAAREVFSDLLERGSAYLPALRVQETDQEGQTALLEAGYAVLKDGVLAGYLEGESAKGLELLVNQAPSDVLEVPLSQGRVVVRVTGSALVCTPRIENGALASVDLNCRVTAEVAEVEGKLTQEDLEQVKQAIDSRQQRRITQALERLQSWGADCVGLGQRLAMADPARGEELLEQWPEVVSSLPVQVSVETSLTRLLFMEES